MLSILLTFQKSKFAEPVGKKPVTINLHFILSFYNFRSLISGLQPSGCRVETEVKYSKEANVGHKLKKLFS